MPFRGSWGQITWALALLVIYGLEHWWSIILWMGGDGWKKLEILRQSISRSEPEGILNHRYRITLTNGDFIETTERLNVVADGPVTALDALEIILLDRP